MKACSELSWELKGPASSQKVAYFTVTVPVALTCQVSLSSFSISTRWPSGIGFDLLDVAAEIADFVERVPGGHLESYLPPDVGNFHGDVEEMLFGMGERDFVADGGVGGRRRRTGTREPENLRGGLRRLSLQIGIVRTRGPAALDPYEDWTEAPGIT